MIHTMTRKSSFFSVAGSVKMTGTYVLTDVLLELWRHQSNFHAITCLTLETRAVFPLKTKGTPGEHQDKK